MKIGVCVESVLLKILPRPAIAISAILAVLVCVMPDEIYAQKYPRSVVNPSLITEPDLLTTYEKRVLNLELLRLMREIRTARAEVAESEAIAPFKAEVDKAQAENKPETEIKELQDRLRLEIEIELYKREGISTKMQRLLDVGTLLRHDKPIEKERRYNHPKRPDPEDGNKLELPPKRQSPSSAPSASSPEQEESNSDNVQ